MMKHVIFVLIAWIFSAGALDFIDQGSYLPIKNLQVEGCSDEAECEILIGADTRVSFTVNTTDLSKFQDNLITEVYLLIRGIKFDVELIPSNACDSLKCPVTDNIWTTYNATLLFDDSFVPIRGELNWILRSPGTGGNEDFYLLWIMFPVVVMRP